MERGPSEALDPAQAATLQIAAAQIGARQVGALEVGVREVGRLQVRAGKVGAGEVRRPSGRRARASRRAGRRRPAPRRSETPAGRRARRSRATRDAAPGSTGETQRSRFARPLRLRGRAGAMAKPAVSGRIGDERPATPQPIVGAGPTGHEGTPADEADARSSVRSRARHAAPSPDWPTSGTCADRYGRAIHAVRRCRHGALPNAAFSPSSEPASNASSTPSVCRCLRLPNVGSSPFSQTDARASRPRVENADDRLGYARSLADRITTRIHRNSPHMAIRQTRTDLTHTGFNPAVARPDVAAGTGHLRVKIISRQFHEEGTRQHM